MSYLADVGEWHTETGRYGVGLWKGHPDIYLDILTELSGETGVSVKELRKLLSRFYRVIESRLCKGYMVRLPGLGVMTPVVLVKFRRRTGKEMPVTVRFVHSLSNGTRLSSSIHRLIREDGIGDRIYGYHIRMVRGMRTQRYQRRYYYGDGD